MAFALHFDNDSSHSKIKDDIITTVNVNSLTKNCPTKRHFLSAALFSAAFGDFLMSAIPNQHLAFSFGAIAFGFCHIFYMVIILKLKKNFLNFSLNIFQELKEFRSE